jgi:peptide/nickel transport system permease protein
MADSSLEKVAETKRLSGIASFLTRLVREKPLGTVGLVITLLLLFTAIFADFLAPYGMNQLHTSDTISPPSSEFWLGTDNLGRDMLSRVIFGARISVVVGLAGASLAALGSTLLGIVSGYLGGKFDLIVQRFVDAVMAIPGIILLVVVMSLVGPGMLQIVVVLGLRWAILGSRIIRSAVIGIKENTYIKAAVAVGCPTSKILIRHILPNVMAPIIIQFSMQVPAIILTEASLSFLGYGIPPPFPSWGGMLGGFGRSYMFLAPWMVIWPGLALSIVVYGVNMFGDAVRDILDPRLRQRG